MTSETQLNLDRKKKEKAEIIHDEMGKQSSFFEMRARHYAELLKVHTFRKPQWVFNRAHECASIDYVARVNEATQLMGMLKAEMRVPLTFEMYGGNIASHAPTASVALEVIK